MMNPFKNVFRSKKGKSLDLLSNFVRASKSTSSISVETVDLDANASTEASEWDTEVEDDKTFEKEAELVREEEKRTRGPVPPDVEPDWSALPLVTFSREVYEAQHTGDALVQPYCNLVLVVVADLHRVLSLKLPRYIVALMSNYRYLNGTSGNVAQVQQMDLYLSNVQEYLDIIRNLEAFEYQKMLHNCCKAISVLASILELCAVHASQDIFFLSFQQQSIAAFGGQYLCEFNVQIEYLEYLLPDGDRQDRDYPNPEVDLDDTPTQTETMLPVIVEEPEVVSAHVQTDNDLDLVKPWSKMPPPFPAEIFIGLANDTVRTYSTVFDAVLDDYTTSIVRKLSEIQGQIRRVDDAKERLCREVLQKDIYLRRLLQELVTRDADLSTIENEKTLLQRRFVDLQTSNDKLNEEKESLMADLSHYTMLAEEKTHLIDELSERIGRLEERNTKMNEERSSLAGDFSELIQKTEERCEELTGQNEELREKISLLEEEVGDNKEKLYHFESVVEELKEQKEQGRTLEERIGALQADLQHQGQTLQLSQQENATLLSRCATLESGGNSQHAIALAVRRKDELLRKLQAALAAAIADGNEMRSDICELKKQRKTLSHTLKTTEDTMQNLQRNVDNLQTNLKQKDATISQLEQFIQCQAQELTTALQRIDLKEDAIAALQSKVEQSRNHIGSLQSTQKALEDNIDEILQQSNSVQNDKEHLETLVRDLTNRNAMLKDDLADMTIECDALRHRQAEPLIELGKNTAELDHARDQIARLQREVRTLQETRDGQQSVRLPVNAAWAETQTDNVDEKEYASLSTQTDNVIPEAQVVKAVSCQGPETGENDRIKYLEAQLEEGRNVLRATEYGKECLALKVSGLQTDNRACEARIRELETTLSTTLTTHAEESESLQADFQAKLYDARCRLAQKGQELEFCRVNADKLIQRTEELSTDLSRCMTARNQAEQRLILLKDQASREVDELELQIKHLRGREEQRAAQFDHKQTSTDQIQSQVSLVQTSISFEYGYDLESGARLRGDDLCVMSNCHKEAQTVPQANTLDSVVQVNPLTAAVLTQTNVENRGFASQTDEADIVTRRVGAVQTEEVDADTRYTQTNEVESTSVLCQTVDETDVAGSNGYSLDLLKLTPSLLDIDNLVSGKPPVGQDLNVVQPQASFSWPVASAVTQMASSSLSAIGEPSAPNVVVNTKDSVHEFGDYKRCEKTQSSIAEINEIRSGKDYEKTDVATSVASFKIRKPSRRSLARNRKSRNSAKRSQKRKEIPVLPPSVHGKTELWSAASDSVSLSAISRASSCNLSTINTERSTPVSATVEAKRIPVQQSQPKGPNPMPKRLDEVKSAPTISSKSSLHDICQFLYDIMSKDLTTRHILIDISNGLDYTLKDEIFDRQFTQKLLRAYDKHHIVRTLLYQQGSAIGNVEELIQKLKSASAPPKASTLKYPGKFRRRNHPDVSEELKRFFREFISNEELGPLEDINSFFAQCFVLLSPASKNLRKTFHDSCGMISRMPDDKRHVAFASLALRFSVRSHKMRDIVNYETGRDPEQTFQKYRLALDRRKHSMALDYLPSHTFFGSLFGMKASN